MPKSYKFILYISLVTICSNTLFAQKKVIYKDVLLNGKPAKLNVATGEFILINGKTIDTIKPLELNSKEEHPPVVKKAIKDSIGSIETIKEVKAEATTTSSIHIVKAGETLFGVSKKYGVTLEELKKANNLQTTLIQVGQRLRVGNFGGIDTTTKTASTWVVSKGDTLYSIAKKNGTSVGAIKQLNGLKGNIIKIGQVLRLK